MRRSRARRPWHTSSRSRGERLLPEPHEVETIRRIVDPRLVGRTIELVEIGNPAVITYLEATLCATRPLELRGGIGQGIGGLGSHGGTHVVDNGTAEKDRVNFLILSTTRLSDRDIVRVLRRNHLGVHQRSARNRISHSGCNSSRHQPLGRIRRLSVGFGEFFLTSDVR